MSPQTKPRPVAAADTGPGATGPEAGSLPARPGPHGHWARSWTFPSTPASVPRCRHAVLRTLNAHGVLGDPADSAALLVTELAGNAVEHATGRQAAEFTVVLGRRGNWLRIEVRDDGRPMQVRRRPAVPEVMATAGRGLFLVQALSGSWGVRSTAGGKAVWCELGVC